MPTRSRPPTENAPGAGPASPVQPIHTPPDSRMTGSRALTSPPGLGRHSAAPSGPSVRSTGSRLDTTTNLCLGDIASTLCAPSVVLATVYCLVTVDNMNSELVTEARQAQERLIDAERDVVVARADFYRAVRRLHLHGSSLRELATDLGLSHQRVHQIVAEAGGSRRWVRARNDSRGRRHELHLACTFCGRRQNQVRKLIAGPGVYICERCIELVTNVIGSGQSARTELGRVANVPEQQTRERCSFCGKARDQVPGLAGIALGPGP